MLRAGWVLVAAVALGAAALLPDSPLAQPVGASGAAVHEGTRGDDTLSGTGADDVIIGKGRHDRLHGLGGNDTLDGGAGRDRLTGGSGQDTLVAGPGRDRLMGGRGDDTINSWDRARDTANCGPGWDTVVADANDVVLASCEQASFSIAGRAGDSGSTLFIDTQSVNDGSGVVHLFLERPRRPLPDCAAVQCGYPNLPTTATALISPEGDIGTQPGFGGDCAGTGISPCRLSMDHDRSATIIFNGSG
jgi:RTX calcium-binding nonapeptide repeat (4 copies)